MMLKPDNHLHLLQYADLQAALGNESVAMKYYLAALEISDCTHGWYGVYATSSKNKQIRDLARTKLTKLYQTQGKGNSKTTILNYLNSNGDLKKQ